MFGINIRSVLVTGVMLFLLVSVAIMAYLMYDISSSKAYVFNVTPAVTGTSPEIKTMSVEGVDAAAYWSKRKLYFASPMILNMISAGMLGLLLYASR